MCPLSHRATTASSHHTSPPKPVPPLLTQKLCPRLHHPPFIEPPTPLSQKFVPAVPPASYYITIICDSATAVGGVLGLTSDHNTASPNHGDPSTPTLQVVSGTYVWQMWQLVPVSECEREGGVGRRH